MWPVKIDSLVPHAYPVLLDVRNRAIVVVGGGAVAARKARGLLEAGATRVRCVALEFCDELPSAVERVSARYGPDYLDGAALVFAATDRPEVNEAVVRDAHARNLLVNRADADEDEPGDFATPARLRQGEVVVTVSAGSPALSAAIRDRLAERFEPRWREMAGAMRELRSMVKASEQSIEERRQILRELAGQEAFAALEQGGVEGLRRWLLERHPELNHA